MSAPEPERRKAGAVPRRGRGLCAPGARGLPQLTWWRARPALGTRGESASVAALSVAVVGRRSRSVSAGAFPCLPTAQASIVVDWSQWVDEAEEEEARRAPLGHDVAHMRGAMGGSFGSNIERDLAAQKQAQRLDTSKEDDEDEEITLC